MSNKVEKSGLVSKLRFPEFRDSGAWGSMFGDDLFDQISNKDHNSDLPVLAITQEQGAIPRNMIDYHVSVTEKSIESYKVVEVGDFIISLRSFQGGIEYSSYKGICSPAYVILRLKAEYSADYFKHFLKTSRFIALLTKNLEGLRDGKMVSYKQFSELQLPTPSLNEQQKIADCLTSLDELLALEAQKLDTLKTHKKGLMQQLFPAEGETLPKLRFSEFRGAGEWEIKSFDEMFSIGNGKDYKHLQSGAIPVYGSGGYMLSVNDYLHDGDSVCIGRKGTINNPFFLTGKFWTVDTLFYTYSFKGCLPRFVYCIFQKINWLKHNEAGGVPSLSKTNISKIKTAVPKLAEQQKIADCIVSIDELIALEAEKIDALKAYKEGMMQHLFPSLEEVTA